MATTAHQKPQEPRKPRAPRTVAKPTFTRNRAALESALPHLATGPQHSALIEAARSLADVVDALMGYDDKAWREYRLTLAALMEATSGGSADAFAVELAELRAPLGDT